MGKRRKRVMYHLVKRLFDIFAGCVGLVVLIPCTLIIGTCILLEDGGPVFFSQKRVTRNGKTFMLHKFRSMCKDAEKIRESMESENEMDGPVFKVKNDKRITKVGRIIRKTGIDELPQLVNVLKGDMSLVGPRPALPREVEKYSEEAKKRLRVKAGITCIWQVQPNRNSISFDDWMKMDAEYVDKCSIGLDIKILFKTVATVFRAEGE